MNTADVKRQILLGTASSYIMVGLRMVLGLITFRLLYQGLSREEFGFWSVLWSVFGYGILLDFGFGLAAQKRVAELSVQKNWALLSQVLSTIFYFYFLSAAILIGIAFLFSGPMMGIFEVSEENQSLFHTALIVFFIGMGLGFPMGIFPEVLRGQQRLLTANLITMVGMIANAVLIALAVWLDWGFLVILGLALACILLPDTVAMILALRHMPEVRMTPAHFSKRQIVETSRFSLFAYLNMLSNVMVNKTDQLVVGSLLNVRSVAFYQAAGKVGEMFFMLTRQLAEVISPAAAHLHAIGDRGALRDMLVNSMRWTVAVATPLYLVTAMYLEGIIRILTGDPKPASITCLVGHILLAWYLCLVTTHLVFKRIFIMAGQERRMMKHGVLEALMNVVLSVVLTLWLRDIRGVALGSLIPTFLLGWGMLWPWAAREAGTGYWELFYRVVVRAWLGCVPLLLVAAGFKFQPWWESGSNTLLVLLEGGILSGIGALGVWHCVMTGPEREELVQRIRRRLGKNQKKAGLS